MGLSISDKIDRIVTHRILALPIFFLVMWAVYYLSINTVGRLGHGLGQRHFLRGNRRSLDGPLHRYSSGGNWPGGLIAVILSMIVLFPLLLRRLHDLNLKGAWMYLTIVPFILAFIVMPNFEEEEASEGNTVPMEAPAAISANVQGTTAEEGKAASAALSLPQPALPPKKRRNRRKQKKKVMKEPSSELFHPSWNFTTPAWKA